MRLTKARTVQLKWSFILAPIAVPMIVITTKAMKKAVLMLLERSLELNVLAVGDGRCSILKDWTTLPISVILVCSVMSELN